MLKITRNGVTNKVMHKNLSVQSPVERIKYSAGLGPMLSKKMPLQSQAKGIKQTKAWPLACAIPGAASKVLH
jgi:hypothetical protein